MPGQAGHAYDTMQHAAHLMGPVGRVATESASIPTVYTAELELLASARRPNGGDSIARRRVPTARCLREYELVAVDREIEIAPGIFFPAWTFNGQVPGPTLRATEGDRVRVTFVNAGTHPHTIHFHGWHPPEMDGSLPEHQVMPGEKFVYEFDADPFGAAPVPLPRGAPEAAHAQGALRRCSSSIRRRRGRPPTKWSW